MDRTRQKSNRGVWADSRSRASIALKFQAVLIVFVLYGAPGRKDHLYDRILGCQLCHSSPLHQGTPAAGDKGESKNARRHRALSSGGHWRFLPSSSLRVHTAVVLCGLLEPAM